MTIPFLLFPARFTSPWMRQNRSALKKTGCRDERSQASPAFAAAVRHGWWRIPGKDKSHGLLLH
jgi:hypothetical protein